MLLTDPKDLRKLKRVTDGNHHGLMERVKKRHAKIVDQLEQRLLKAAKNG